MKQEIPARNAMKMKTHKTDLEEEGDASARLQRKNGEKMVLEKVELF